MLAWLDPAPSPRLVHHLPDASSLLPPAVGAGLRPDAAASTGPRRAAHRRQLARDVADQRRAAIQLHDLGDRYSMIRHHALMLFYAALWLDEPRRSQWLDLYDKLVTQVDSSKRGRPDLAELQRIETDTFADFARLADQTRDPAILTVQLWVRWSFKCDGDRGWSADGATCRLDAGAG